MTTARMRQAFRKRLSNDGIVAAPGTGDPLGARLIERAGFEAVYISGYAVAATYGLPDVGLLGSYEMSERATQIVEATQLPVIADADDGYGGTRNVVRAVRDFERAGVAALHLEDQATPKRCGSEPGKRLVSAGEMVDKLKAAIDTRDDAGMLIIARTDALASEGVEAAMERAAHYVEAGADMLLIHGPYDEAMAERLMTGAPGPVAYFNSETLTMPIIPDAKLESWGVRLVIYPLTMLLAAARAMEVALDQIATGTGTQAIIADHLMKPAVMSSVVDLDGWVGAGERTTRAGRGARG